jgi:glycogen debranching enzyme
MPYSPLDNEMKQKMLEVVAGELLTPKGLRTLSPKNPAYRGIYEGDRGDQGFDSSSGNGLSLASGALCRGLPQII